MVRLYTHQDLCRWQRRKRRSLGLAMGLLAAATAVCILLCTHLTTANTQRLLLADITLFTLAGWIAMLVLYFTYAPAKAQANHMASMLQEEPSVLEGMLQLQEACFRIPKSITVRKASLETQEGTLSLSVCASLAWQLPQGKRLRVWAVRSYIIAYEVLA